MTPTPGNSSPEQARPLSRRPYLDMEMCHFSDGHSPRHQPRQSIHHSPPQRRMRDIATVHPIFVYEPTSGIMKQPDVHCHTRNLRPKSRLPKVSGHSPRGKSFSRLLVAISWEPLCFSPTWARQSFDDPRSTTRHRTPPQLSHCQMLLRHVFI